MEYKSLTKTFDLFMLESLYKNDCKIKFCKKYGKLMVEVSSSFLPSAQEQENTESYITF